jgi:hypothetical protein
MSSLRGLPRIQDKSVSIATGYGMDGRRLIPGRSKIFSSPWRLDWLWGHPASYKMGTGGCFPGD